MMLFIKAGYTLLIMKRFSQKEKINYKIFFSNIFHQCIYSFFFTLIVTIQYVHKNMHNACYGKLIK